MQDASNAFTSQTNVSFAFKTQIEICLKIKCVLNANAKSQTRKSMKIHVICTVPVTIVYRNISSKIFGVEVGYPEQISGVLRTLLKYAGIYSDLDVIVLNSLDPLRHHPAVMGSLRTSSIRGGGGG